MSNSAPNPEKLENVSEMRWQLTCTGMCSPVCVCVCAFNRSWMELGAWLAFDITKVEAEDSTCDFS